MRAEWLLGSLLACAGLGYVALFFTGYVPASTLPVQELSASELRTWDYFAVCGDSASGFSEISPDGKWHVSIGRASFRDADELRLYAAGSERPLGRYSFHNLHIYCWAKDSSGIYISDSAPGFELIPIALSPPADWHSNPKKILVP